MHANHSATGQLRTGTTIVRAVEIWEAESTNALRALLDEAAGMIETRGREWDRAMRAYRDAIWSHQENAPSILEASFRIAAPPKRTGGSIHDAADQLIRNAATNLQLMLGDFQDGWTAPPGKHWHERHPIFFSLISAAVGSIVTVIGFFVGS